MDSKKIIASTILAVAIAGGGFAAGVVGMPGISGAQDSTTTAPGAATPAAPDSSTAPSTGAATPAAPGTGHAPRGAGAAPSHDPKLGGHVGQNGTTETLLTGDTAAKVTAAAQAAVPDGTIERVENDAEGATYEAHMTKADGSEVTVKLDATFAVTGTETGPGGPGGPH